MPESEEIREETVTSPPTQPNANHDIWKFSAELVRTAIIVAVIAYVVRLFIFQPFIVEGSSMAPQFRTDDYLLVDKVSYRFTTPQRGDIIVFKYPLDTSVNYVKRVIGLPGETVHIQDGKVKIINDQNPQGIVLNEPYVSTGSKTLLPSNVTKTDFTIPNGYYFVLGDNRPYSSDSREWGLLPYDDITGSAKLVLFPFNRATVLPKANY